MIRVRCLGHIGTAVGSREVELNCSSADASEIVECVRSMAGGRDLGFNKYNTLVMVEEGEAFVPAGSDRRLTSGERVVLIPFSHGG